jgi:hypothetical protein
VLHGLHSLLLTFTLAEPNKYESRMYSRIMEEHLRILCDEAKRTEQNDRKRARSPKGGNLVSIGWAIYVSHPSLSFRQFVHSTSYFQALDSIRSAALSVDPIIDSQLFAEMINPTSFDYSLSRIEPILRDPGNSELWKEVLGEMRARGKALDSDEPAHIKFFALWLPFQKELAEVAQKTGSEILDREFLESSLRTLS